MSSTNKRNKVKFNICNVHYAPLSQDNDGKYTWATPVALPGAVSLSLDPQGEPESFSADGIEYYVINNNQGYDGDLELALIPESFRRDILMETTDTNSVLLENAANETGKFALLFDFLVQIRAGLDRGPIYKHCRRRQCPRCSSLIQHPLEYPLYRFLCELVAEIIAHRGEVRQFLV